MNEVFQNDTYTYNHACPNCGQHTEVEVPRGKLAPTDTVECSYCGCTQRQWRTAMNAQAMANSLAGRSNDLP